MNQEPLAFLSKDGLGIRISQDRSRIQLPESWRKAFLQAGIPPTIFLNQALVSKNDYKQLEEVTIRFNALYEEVVEKIKKMPGIYAEVKSVISYYVELKKTGELPNRCIKPPNEKAQIEISNLLVEILTKKIGGVHAFNTLYDMQAGVKQLGNCLVTCLYYVIIARRLCLNAEIYSVPDHAIIGLRLLKGIQFVDPTMGLKKVELEKKEFLVSKGKLVIDYSSPKKIDFYGLSQAFVNKASALNEIGKNEEALDAAETAITIDPNNADAWSSRGVALQAKGNYKDALESYDKAIELNPKESTAWNNKGLLYLLVARNGKLQFYEKAIHSFDRAIEANSNLFIAWYNKGIALEESGRNLDALKAFNNSLELNKGYANAWYLRGEVLDKLGRTKEAIDSYNDAIKLDAQVKEKVVLR